MKTLILVALLLAAHAAPAPAEIQTCTGRVQIDVVTDNDGLNRKGDRVFSVGGCAFTSSVLEKQVLRTCPLGSRCRVEGTPGSDDAIETIKSVTRVQAEWFLTVHIYSQTNRGSLNPPETRHLKHAFATRDDCLARWRVFQKTCSGLIADNSATGYSVAKFTGLCQQRAQQPEPVLVAPEIGAEHDDPAVETLYDAERKCAH